MTDTDAGWDDPIESIDVTIGRIDRRDDGTVLRINTMVEHNTVRVARVYAVKAGTRASTWINSEWLGHTAILGIERASGLVVSALLADARPE